MAQSSNLDLHERITSCHSASVAKKWNILFVLIETLNNFLDIRLVLVFGNHDDFDVFQLLRNTPPKAFEGGLNHNFPFLINYFVSLLFSRYV